MKPRKITQEDVDFWNDNDENLRWEIVPMRGDHLGAANIESVLREPRANIVKVAWEKDERDDPRMWSPKDTVWTTFWGGMPPSDVVILRG